MSGPPRWSRRLLRLVLPPADREAVDADMEAMYRTRRARDGAASADRWYRRQVIGFVRRAWRIRRLWRPFDVLRQDVGFAWRQLGRRPGGSLLAVLVLVLGLASGTVVFSIVDAVVLRSLPYPAPEELVQVAQVDRESGRESGVAPPAFLLWSETAEVAVGSVAAFTAEGRDLEGVGEPVHLEVTAASHELFDALGVAPLLGRTFDATEDRAGAGATAVLSHGLWSSRFGGRADVVGRSIRLGGEPHTVVGVMPEGFDFPAGSEAWVPLRPQIAGMSGVWGALFLDVVARRHPGADIAAVRAELGSLLERHPDAARWSATATPLRDAVVGDVERSLLLLLGAVGLVLAVACANVGGLLLSRALGRRRELAVRTALGAGRGRVWSALLAEGVLLASLAGVLGIAVSHVALDLVVSLAPSDLPRASEIGLDARVVAAALGATLLAGIAAGVIPALRVRPDLSADLRDGRGEGADRGSARIRNVLVGGQVALTVVLLTGAGLLARSFLAVMAEPAGFEPSGVATAELTLPSHRYPDAEALRAFYGDLLREGREVPGASRVALSRNLPMAGRRLSAPVEVEGLEREGSWPAAQVSSVSPEYFDVMRIPVVRGRNFSPGDRDGPPLLVVNEAFERAFLGGGSAIGRRARTFLDRELMEIVGVVGDVRHGGLDRETAPIAYRLLDHVPERGVHLVVRAEAPPTAVLPALRAAVAGARPGQPVQEVTTMTSLVARSAAGRRFYASLLVGFGATALLLSALGLYALVSGVVQRMRREIGIRIALGARPALVSAGVVGRGLGAAGVGLLAGLLGAALLGGTVEGLLYGVSTVDPWTLAGVALLLLLTTLAAALPGARRATRIDPVDAMRV